MESRSGKGIKEPCGWIYAQKGVWEYTIAIAEEAQSFVFDELNFDYIRFPSDGSMKDIKYPHCDATLAKPDCCWKIFL